MRVFWWTIYLSIYRFWVVNLIFNSADQKTFSPYLICIDYKGGIQMLWLFKNLHFVSWAQKQKFCGVTVIFITMILFFRHFLFVFCSKFPKDSSHFTESNTASDRWRKIRNWLYYKSQASLRLTRGGGYSPTWAILVCAALKGRGFAPFWSVNGYRLCLFWPGIGYGFQGELRECMNEFIVSIPNGKKRKKNVRIPNGF